MGLKSVLSAKIEVKANKDIFHDVFTHKPHHLSTICPVHIQGCELLEGVFGTIGSKISWTYKLGKSKNIHDDKVILVLYLIIRKILKYFQSRGKNNFPLMK